MTFAAKKALILQSRTDTSTVTVRYHASSPSEATAEFLAGSLSNTLTLQKPLLVFVEQAENSSYVVSEQQFGVYGVGANKVQAELDYMKSLAEYYEILRSRAAENFPTSRLFKHLCEYVSSR